MVVQKIRSILSQKQDKILQRCIYTNNQTYLYQQQIWKALKNKLELSDQKRFKKIYTVFLKKYYSKRQIWS